MPEKLTIGARIGRMRRAQHLTQKELGEKTGVSRSLIGQIEAGNVKPTLEFLYKFIRICDSTYDFVLEGKEAEEEPTKAEEPAAPYLTASREVELLREMLSNQESTIAALQSENDSLKKLILILEAERQKNRKLS